MFLGQSIGSCVANLLAVTFGPTTIVRTSEGKVSAPTTSIIARKLVAATMTIGLRELHLESMMQQCIHISLLMFAPTISLTATGLVAMCTRLRDGAQETLSIQLQMRMAGASDFLENHGKILFEETKEMKEDLQKHAECEKDVNAGDHLSITEMMLVSTRVCAAAMVLCLTITNMMVKVWTYSSMDGTVKTLMVDAWMCSMRNMERLGMTIMDGAVEFMRQPTCVKLTAQKDLAGVKDGEHLVDALKRLVWPPMTHAVLAEEDGVIHNTTKFQEKLSDDWTGTLTQDIQTWFGERS